MRITVERVEVLVRQILDEARKTLDVPAVQDILYCFPGGKSLWTMIKHPAPTPVKYGPRPIVDAPRGAPVVTLVAPAAEPAVAEPPPSVKAPHRVSKPPAAKPPVPTGTRVRVLTGAFTGWTGPLQWSPAKSAYNVRLTGPDGKQTRTTLSPSRLGTTWEVESTAAPAPRAAKQKRKEAQS